MYRKGEPAVENAARAGANENAQNVQNAQNAQAASPPSDQPARDGAGRAGGVRFRPELAGAVIAAIIVASAIVAFYWQ